MSNATYSTSELLQTLEDMSAEITLAFFPVLYRIDAAQLRIPQRAASYDTSDKPKCFYARHNDDGTWTFAGRFYRDDEVSI